MTDSHDFRVVLRGYDPHQVDRRIHQLVEDAEDARREVASLATRVQQLEAEQEAIAEGRDKTPGHLSFGHLGERVGRILALAEEEAEELRRRGREEAEAAHAEVHDTVAGIRTQADHYATQRRSDADTESARILEDARRAADERLDAAERDAAARLQEAEAIHEDQRAKAARAAADFETTLAQRRQQAEQEFTQQMAEAQERLEDLERHVEKSRAEAETEHNDAVRESRRITSEAEQQADTIVGDAKALAARVRADSERELAAASQRRDSINAQLANVRQMLTTLTGVPPALLLDPTAEAAADAPADNATVPSDKEEDPDGEEDADLERT